VPKEISFMVVSAAKYHKPNGNAGGKLVIGSDYSIRVISAAYTMEEISFSTQLIKIAMCAVWTQKPSPPETGVLMVAHGVRSAARQSFINVVCNFALKFIGGAAWITKYYCDYQKMFG
jgi:hypothetical protein